MQMLNFKQKIKTVLHHPSIIKSIIYGKRLDEIRADLNKVDNYETMKFISYIKQNIPYFIDSSNRPKFNRLCSLEDWNNDEIRQTISELRKIESSYYNT